MTMDMSHDKFGIKSQKKKFPGLFFFVFNRYLPTLPLQKLGRTSLNLGQEVKTN